MSAATRVLERLDGVKRSGDGWTAKCPAHDDGRASLTVSVGDDERCLVRCHAGCGIEEVVAAIGLTLAGLFESDSAGPGAKRIVETYDYVDEQGALLFQAVRFEPKDFRQRRPDGNGGWVWSLGRTRRVLYRLPRVVEAAAAGGTVYVVEGEKDVLALEAAGAVATTCPMGADKWRDAYSRALRGADVVIVADRDEPGLAHAVKVAGSLAGMARSVRIVEAADGKDAADHLAAGLSVADFVAVAPESDESATDPGRPLPDLAPLLDAAEAFLRRYVALTEAQYVAVTLWVAHAHALDATSTTPYLHVTSPEAESGKSRLLECLEPLVPTPLYAASMTPAVLFRAVHTLTPTLLIDEADNLFRDREAKSELLGLLNAGYRRGARAYRIGGGNRDELQAFETFSAKVIAGLDDLVTTLASRCLRIEMQRRRADEPIEDFFREAAQAEAAPIRDALTGWAGGHVDALRTAQPARLGVRDRLEEGVRLPLAIATLAGERWETRTREALRELAGVSGDGSLSERTQLLVDIRDVFAAHDHPDELKTGTLLDGLISLDESPWRGWWGVERDGEVHASKGAAQKLSLHLRSFKIKSHDIGPKGARRKGYRRADFEDAWGRYLTAPPSTPGQTPRTPRTSHGYAENEGFNPAHRGDGCAGLDTAQSRMVKPGARGARLSPGEGADGTRQDGFSWPDTSSLKAEQAILADAQELVDHAGARWSELPADAPEWERNWHERRAS